MTHSDDKISAPNRSPDASVFMTRLAHIRHRLCTAINAIVGYTEILQEDLATGTPQSDLDLLETIHECGLAMLSQVDQILDPETSEEDSHHLQQAFESGTLEKILQQKLEASLQRIGDCSEQLLNALPSPATNDLRKVLQASQQLKDLIPQSHGTSKNSVNAAGADENLQVERKPYMPELVKQVFELPNSLEILTAHAKQTEIEQSGKILVVDDNDNNRDLLSRQLVRQGYSVATAANGAQALQMVEADTYDLILLDMVMPVLSGYEVLVRLKKTKHLRHIPVILVSALDKIDSVIGCINQGAEDYLLKPFNSTLLIARINACLKKKRQREQEIVYAAQRLIAESTPVPILMFQIPDGRILYANSTATNFFGLSKPAFLEHSFWGFCHHLDEHNSLLSKLIQDGIVQDRELRMKRADNTLFWATVSISPLQLNQESVGLAAFWDISDRKQAEAILRQNEAKLKQQLAALKVEINEINLREEVSEITGTDFFKDLKEKAARARQRNHQHRNSSLGS